ncbi:MAG TPA: ankyrin repeat domain-containing protein [Blastocatellia bacterium]|jgi:serine/threonine protein kinase|nr:ankyrin repeat domain-containing protein [Blastocatellia bacterium]
MAKLAKLIGQVIDGKYQLDKRLGQGGMGAVYLATHLGTKRPVALKVIAPQFMANEEVGERFRREAEAAGRLRHPNVVNVTDFGVASLGKDKLAYLVMEYLDGCSLGDMIKEKGRLPLPLVTDIVEQICLAIGNAHQQGVIHRDLKPDNIWLQPDQRGGYNVKVLDFGLAKLRDSSATGAGDESARVSSPGMATRAFTNRKTDTIRAVAVTQPQPHDGTNIEAHTQIQTNTSTELEAATQIQTAAIADEEKTAIYDRQESADLEAATRIHPSAFAANGGDDNATRIQTVAPADEEGGRSAHQETTPSGSGASSYSTTELTRVGSVLGTPLYMSPEQCRSGALDARSDIYSLGVIVYLILAGRPPFEGGMSELITKHMEEQAPPLDTLRGDIPKSVSALVMTALAKNPEDRPATAEAFAVALRATAEGETQILRQAKSYYYTSQRTFFGLSLFVYLPFAIISIASSVILDSTQAGKSLGVVLGFYGFVFLLILFATKLCAAACTLALKELWMTPTARVKLKPIMAAYLERLPSLLATAARSNLAILFGLARLIVPGARVYIDHALFPSVVMIEGRRGADALARSKSLVAPLRPIATALQARDFGLSLGAIIFFPFVTVVMAFIFGGSGLDAFGALTTPMMKNFIVGYCWFLLTIMHTAYMAIPAAMLYFKSRQARGEAVDESGLRDWQQEEVKRRPEGMNKATLAWFAVPLVMLAFMILFPMVGGGGSLIEVVRKGRLSAVKKTLASGADANVKRTGGTTALMYAAKDGQVEIIKALLDAGAGLNAKDMDGDTALIYAAIDGRVDAAKALLAAGADVNARNNKDQTALMSAAMRGRDETVKALLEAGADAGAKDGAGRTALMYAEEEGHATAARTLKEAGAGQ